MSRRPPNHRPTYVTDSRSEPLPPYRVVLRHTPNTQLMGVVRAIMELTRLCREEATHRMWESYHRGHAQLLVTHKERAELYVEQFAEYGVGVTIEPV